MDQRILVAMSGGLDSGMAVILLREQGYTVEGLTMRLWRQGQSSDHDVNAARALCAQLGIPHHAVDLREAFLRQVVDPFVAEYARGRTPNPCIPCNRHLKFGALLDYARRRKALLATGHYCRIALQDGLYRLLPGVDERKDQSYFLYTLGQRELREIRFPLGDLTKDAVRRMARERGLSLAERPESQDVCFLPHGSYGRFVAEKAPGAVRPGPILNRDGEKLGEHRGLAHYTIGQRAGLGISAPQALYVLQLDPERNAVIVGYADALGGDGLIASDMSYVSGEPPREALRVRAKIRYRARPAHATLTPSPDARARLHFDEPLRDITPGQAVVAYVDGHVLGGGTITYSESQASSENR